MITTQCLDLIKEFEGFKPNAYLCPAKILTIGYGTTNYRNGGKVKVGDKIDRKKAELELYSHCEEVKTQIESVVKSDINSNQLSALISFVYNLGIINFKASTILRLINESELNDAANQFDKWIYSNGEVLQGLVKRRAKEKLLFLS
jgi:lysozyme